MKESEIVLKRVKAVVAALIDLQTTVYGEEKCQSLFEDGVSNTLALPMSLNEFIAEWQSLHEYMSSDKEALFCSWKRSAVTKRESKHDNKEDVFCNCENNDITFEDGSYINLLVVVENSIPVLKYAVEICRDCTVFTDYDNACAYLWENHAKEGYGV